jgi:hypothetical protein
MTWWGGGPLSPLGADAPAASEASLALRHGLDQRFGFCSHGEQGLLLRRLVSIFALVS